MHCRPTLRHLHAQADGPVVEQVGCWVQLQHRSTISRARLIEQLTVELAPNSPVGVSPFLFCPLVGPAAVNNLDTPPAIARPYLLLSEIAAGLLHRQLTPLAHSHGPLARRRPRLHRGVCVTYLLSSLYATTPILTSSVFPLPSVPSYTTTPRFPLLYADNQ